MTILTGPPPKAIRNKPIAAELQRVLEAAGQAAGVDTIQITSGGQDALGEGTRRTGSTRHDRGRAADLQLVVGGTVLTFTDHSAHSTILAFVTAAAAAGATGIGAGVGYMGNRTIHVGFGTSVDDETTLTWGEGGRSANAPQWLRDAAAAGWAAPAAIAVAAAPGVRAPGRYVVIARDGLKLRGGPGTNFGSERTLPAGTELNVVQISGEDPSWVRVGLEGDRLVDGYVFANFLAPVSAEASSEYSAEPGAGDHA
jgi:Bacterial SH3 domain